MELKNIKYHILILIFILSTIIAILVKAPPAEGYEFSLYIGYPFYFWLLLISSYIICVYMIVYHSIYENKSNVWVLGFLGIQITILIISLIPVFRGYSVYGRGDVLQHIGWIKDIIWNGHIADAASSSRDFYPATHILGASLNYVTGLSAENIANIMPVIFMLFYILSIYVLAFTLTNCKGKALLVAAFGTLLSYTNENFMLMPFLFSFFMLPYCLYIYIQAFSENSLKSKLILVSLVALPLIHPGEGTILFLATLFIMHSLSYLLDKFGLYFSEESNRGIIKPKMDLKLNMKMTTIIILFILFWLGWFLSFPSLREQAITVLKGLTLSFFDLISIFLTEAFQSTLSHQWNTDIIEGLRKANLGILSFFALGTRVYGQIAIYYLISMALGLITFKNIITSKSKVDPNQILFSILFTLFGLLFLASLILDLGTEFFRIMKYATFFSIFLNGIGLYNLSFIKNDKKIAVLCITSILAISATISMFNIYTSPSTRGLNPQVTTMELQGTGWLLNNRDKSDPIDSIDVSQTVKFIDALIGLRARCNDSTLRLSPSLQDTFEHFNYNIYSAYGSSYNNDRYFIDWKAIRFFYPEIFPDFKQYWRFNSEDFYHLDNVDTSVEKIYSNPEFWVYHVNAINSYL